MIFKNFLTPPNYSGPSTITVGRVLTCEGVYGENVQNVFSLFEVDGCC